MPTDNINPPQSNDEFKLIVDYKALEQTIADGQYDYVDPDIIAEHFPISPELIGKKIEIIGKLFHFERHMENEEVISEMDKDGFRPGTLMELSALAVVFPELQRQFPIFALGSVWRCFHGFRFVPCLIVDDGVRKLDLTYFDFYWCDSLRFLGVRK